jgi:hypothetical protein
MILRDCLRAAGCFLAGLGLLLCFSGCEDPQARSEAQESAKAIAQLKAEVDRLKTQNAQLLEALQGIPAKLAAQINERADKVTDQVLSKSKELEEQLGKSAADIRKAASDKVATVQEGFDKQLETTKAALAGEIQKIREETKAALDELKKYMDNQLRELYPYAYQPRREGSKAPPAPDAKPN